MSLWTPLQRDYLEGMGFEVLRQRGADAAVPVAVAVAIAEPGAAPATPSRTVTDALQRAARNVDLAALLAETGHPVDASSRRSLWRRLRPLRKAARGA